MSLESTGRTMLLGLLVTGLAGCGSSSSSGASPDGGMGSQDSSTGSPDGTPSDDGGGGSDGPVADAARDATRDGAGEGGPPKTPTVSSWLGTNLDADLPYADVTYMLSAF